MTPLPDIHRRWNNQVLISEVWYVEGSLQRTDGPARQRWNSEGVLLNEIWYINGNLHRTGGPANRRWNSEGILLNEIWYTNGFLHRTDGPATQRWNDEGVLLSEIWYLDGKVTTGERTRRSHALHSGRTKVMRSLRLLAVASAVPSVPFDALASIGRFL